jgi:predicted permease
MNLFILTFESVAVLLGIGIVGYWIIKKRILKLNDLGLLSPLVLDVALPSLIFSRIVTDFSLVEYPDWWQIPIWWCFFTLIVGLLTFIFMFISKKEFRSEFGMSLFYQNAIFFPLAIISGIYPSEGKYLIYLFFFTIFYPAFFFSTYSIFFKTKQKFKIDFKKIFHPVLIVTLVAIFSVFLGLKDFIPDIGISIATLLGSMTVPLIMIILGGNIYLDFHKKGKIQYFEIIKFVLTKNFLFPIIFLIIIMSIKSMLSFPIALILIIQSAIPPVTAIPLVTEKVGGNRSIANQFIISSFVTSLISIPIMIYLFGLFYVI